MRQFLLPVSLYICVCVHIYIYILHIFHYIHIYIYIYTHYIYVYSGIHFCLVVNLLWSSDPFFSPPFFFWLRMAILCLSHYYILNKNKFLSSFTGPQRKKKCSKIDLVQSFIHDIGDEIGNILSRWYSY